VNRKRLGIYLNDHLAGATVGRELASRSLGSNRGTAYGGFLEELLRDIEEDRQALEDLMARLGIGKDPIKVTLAWAGEKVGRLKTNGQLLGYSPLSRLEELEGLALGVLGKLALWEALRELADRDPILGEVDLERLFERAESQVARLREQRRLAALEAFDGA
jgi:hypothetical protein